MTTTQTRTLEGLGTMACNTAMLAAANWINANGHKATAMGRIAVLQSNLRREVKAALDGAMDDAREAIACGMTDAAEQTFRASMALAGIAAAKATVATEAR